MRFGIEDYEKCFNPKDFLNMYCREPEDDFHWNSFILSNFHKFWSGFGSNNLTMLEFGGGPSIYTLISACPFVREIVFAELTEANRKEVEEWQKRGSSSHDWSPFFKYVLQKLEGKSEKEAKQREEELRKKITHIIPCDINKTNPLQLKEFPIADQPKFDIISTTACLEAAVKSDDAYCEAVAKLSKLLKPGGHLIMAGP